MSSLNKSPFLRIFLSYLPLLILFFSVFNEFDFNYLKLDYFAFNFAHLLILPIGIPGLNNPPRPDV